MSKKPSKNNNSSKSSKKIICFILIGILIIIGIGLLVFFLLKNKAKEPNDIVVSEVDMVVPLDKEDEAQAAKLIKENIVRISNNIRWHWRNRAERKETRKGKQTKNLWIK